MNLLESCNCESTYTIEEHGDGHVIYYGRCSCRHGYNLVYLNDLAFNCDLKHLETLLQLGHRAYTKQNGRFK